MLNESFQNDLSTDDAPSTSMPPPPLPAAYRAGLKPWSAYWDNCTSMTIPNRCEAMHSRLADCSF